MQIYGICSVYRSVFSIINMIWAICGTVEGLTVAFARRQPRYILNFVLMAISGYLQYRRSVFHFVQFGHGSEVLLAFHGFSESGSSFLPLSPSLGNRYTIYAFDLPYHGKTRWNEPSHFTTSDLVEMIRLFLAEQNIQRFSVLGFSMGGKCALFLTAHFAVQIDTVWLLASDGIRTNRIYNVAVYPKWGRELFKTTIRYPGWIFATVKVAVTFRLISPWLQKFTNNHMATREKRQRLYDTWISMAGFNPDISAVKAAMVQHHISSVLIFGKRDEVILPAVGASFAEGLPGCTLQIIERGHYFIDERLNPVLEDILKDMRQ